MSDEITMSIRHPDGEWKQVGEPVTPQSKPGSFSSEDAIGRHVFLFGWIDHQSGLWRSMRGWDFELDMMRSIVSENLILISNLEKPFTMTIQRSYGPVRVSIERS